MAKDYTADTIGNYSNLKHIRQRPTVYIVSRGNAGIVHLLKEYTENFQMKQY